MVDDDGRGTDDGRTPDHGHPISSPCEPNGSGELKIQIKIPIEIRCRKLPIKVTQDEHDF